MNLRARPWRALALVAGVALAAGASGTTETAVPVPSWNALAGVKLALASAIPLGSRLAGLPWLLCLLLAAAVVVLRARLVSRRARATLEASEACFRVMADTAPVMIWMSGTDRGCTFFNKPWLAFTGRRLEQELGDGWAQGVHAADLAHCLATYTQAFDARRPFAMEYRLRHADGAYRWILDNGQPRLSPAGDFLGYIGSCVDITERRGIEDALRESERRLRLLIHGLDAIVWEGDLTGFNFVSGAADAPLGYAIAEWLQPGFWAEHLHPDDRERALREGAAASAHGDDHVLSYRMLTADGRAVWLEDRVRVVRAPDGAVRLIGLLFDVSATVELEDALRRAADEWTRTFDALDAAVVLLTADGRALRLNRSAQHLADCAFRDCLGRSLDELSSVEPWASAAALVREFAAGGARSRQTRDPTTGRSWDLSVEALPGTAHNAPRAILMMRNVTGLVELQESMRKAETMAALGAIVAGVAHEVRNPLFAMSANIDALELELRGELDLREILDALRQERDRISGLMEDLLEYGRPAPMQPACGSFRQVINAAVASNRLLAAHTGVCIVADGDDVVVSVDAGRLVEVFTNLIENACQHAPAGSRVEIAWTVEHVSGQRCLRSRVRDHGPGIPEDLLGRVFEPFVTRRVGGTGLGLSIVQRIVEAHSGRVSAANAPDGGALMTVELPLH